MSNPRVLDFSAEEEDVITIKFPQTPKEKRDGKSWTCELPTMEELTMPVFQFISSNGDEWYGLFEKRDLTNEERIRLHHLNNSLAYALCADVPRRVVDRLSARQKAKVIVGFMTASPELLETAKQMAEAQAKERTSAR
jgi:hypothetical protein